MIYFDNSATSLIKPPSVYRKIKYVMKHAGGNPGRGGNTMAQRASDEVFLARLTLADFFNIENVQCICFTCNATMGINTAIKGIVKENDHVIISAYEHNSVLRPLHKLTSKGISYSVLKPDFSDLEEQIKENTKMIIINHVSNVCGNVAPIRKIGETARKKGIIFMVDASQSAGHISVDVKRDNIDILVCSGHKGLFGMQGTGALYIREDIYCDTLIEGGTGSMSLYRNQPDIMPDRFEAGTLNTPGIASLGEGVKFIQKTGLENISLKTRELSAFLVRELERLDKVVVYGDRTTSLESGVIGFNIEGCDSGIAASLLCEGYKIMVRGGMHCSYLAHKTLNTLDVGCIRASLGFFNTKKECEKFLHTVDKIRSMVV